MRHAAPGCREVLARNMTHNATTADRHYVVVNQRDNAIKVTHLIASVMEGTQRSVEQSIHWSGEQATPKIVELDEEIEQEISENQIEENDEVKQVEDYRDVYNDFTDLDMRKDSRNHRRRTFTEEEASKLVDLRTNFKTSHQTKATRIRRRTGTGYAI